MNGERAALWIHLARVNNATVKHNLITFYYSVRKLLEVLRKNNSVENVKPLDYDGPNVTPFTHMLPVKFT